MLGALFFCNTAYSGCMSDDLIKAFDGYEHQVGTSKRRVEVNGEQVKVHLNQDVSDILADAERLRNHNSWLNARPDFDNEGFVHVGRIPLDLYRLWEASLPQGITPELKHQELMKLLSGEWAKLNVSKYKRLS